MTTYQQTLEGGKLTVQDNSSCGRIKIVLEKNGKRKTFFLSYETETIAKTDSKPEEG